MRKNLLFIFGIIFSITIYAQTNDDYKSAKLISGCPKDLEPIKNQLGLKNLTFTNFETGIDSVKIVFGELTQGNINGYWISSYFNNNVTSFSTVSLEKEKSSDYFSNNIVIKLDNSAEEISLYVKCNPATNEILYFWQAGDKKSDKLTIQKVDRLLEENKLLPELNLRTLTNENILSSDFKGKFLVINWWNTGCASCRVEIPGLNTLVEKYKTTPNIKFLAISPDKKERLENYLKSNEFKYSQTIGNKEVSKIFKESFPQNIIVNPQGVVTYWSAGGNEKQYLEIDKFLKEQLNDK